MINQERLNKSLDELRLFIKNYDKLFVKLQSNFPSILKKFLQDILINSGYSYQIVKRLLKTYNIRYVLEERELKSIYLQNIINDTDIESYRKSINECLISYFEKVETNNKSLLNLDKLESFNFRPNGEQ